MKEKLLKNRKLIDVIIIILVGVLVGIPLLSKNLDVYIDDGVQHIARAYGTLESIKKDGLFPNIISSFANNFGYSWNLFYGPLSTYGIIFLNLICNNIVSAYKIFVFVCLICSGFTMYKFMYGITKNNNVGILASILYMTFPYHLTDLYIRNALGEYVSFIFIPLVFLGLYNLFYTTENHYYLTFGAVGLIITHNISTVMVAFFSLVYLVVNLPKLKETRVKKGLILNIIFIILISAFFWIPMLETNFFTNYQAYEPGMMSSSDSTANNGLKLKQLFVTENDGSFVFELGLHIIIMLAFSVMAVRMVREDLKETYIVFLILGILTLWMSTKYFPWRFLPEQVSIVQFPWRFLMMSGFFFSFICSINMFTIIRNFNYKDVIVISIIAVIYLTAFIGYLSFNENLPYITDFDLGRISGKEVETVAGTAKAEYLPVKAYKNRFYIATREDNIYVLDGKALVEKEVKDKTTYTAKIKTYEVEYTIFELPYIYYPGYEVRLDGISVQTFETENGFLGFAMGANDEVSLDVEYTGTTAMKISSFISIISLMAFGIYVWKKH